jgi:hypothetical protein
MPAVRSRALKRAIEIVGGIEILAAQLDVSSDDVVLWSQGTKGVPEEVFLRAVDIVTAAEVNDINGKHHPINEPDAER